MERSAATASGYEVIPTGPFVITMNPKEEASSSQSVAATRGDRNIRMEECGFQAILRRSSKPIESGCTLYIWRVKDSYHAIESAWWGSSNQSKNPLTTKVTFYVNGKELVMPADQKGAPPVIFYGDYTKGVSISIELENVTVRDRGEYFLDLAQKMGDVVRARLLPLIRYEQLKFAAEMDEASIATTRSYIESLFPPLPDPVPPLPPALFAPEAKQEAVAEEWNEFVKYTGECFWLTDQGAQLRIAVFFNYDEKTWKIQEVDFDSGTRALFSAREAIIEIDDIGNLTIYFNSAEGMPQGYRSSTNNRTRRLIQRHQQR